MGRVRGAEQKRRRVYAAARDHESPGSQVQYLPVALNLSGNNTSSTLISDQTMAFCFGEKLHIPREESGSNAGRFGIHFSM